MICFTKWFLIFIFLSIFALSDFGHNPAEILKGKYEQLEKELIFQFRSTSLLENNKMINTIRWRVKGETWKNEFGLQSKIKFEKIRNSSNSHATAQCSLDQCTCVLQKWNNNECVTVCKSKRNDYLRCDYYKRSSSVLSSSSTCLFTSSFFQVAKRKTKSTKSQNIPPHSTNMKQQP